MIVNHPGGRLHLVPADSTYKDASFKIPPNETKNYRVEFPNPIVYATLLDRGAANLHIILRPIEGNELWIESLPFDRLSLQRYYLPFNISID